MLKTALSPRWLALLAVLLIVVYSFFRLGLWQWSNATSQESVDLLAEQALLDPVAITQVTEPRSAFPEDGSGKPVIAEGSYDAERQFYVPDRVLNGDLGYWVMTPLDTSQGVLLVLRGWVADPVDADLPPATGVTVTGTLAPGESPALDVDLANNLMTSVDLGVLINAWDDDLYNAFIFATDESPQVSADSVAEVPPPTLANRDIDWGNLGYALQWWVFAAFAVYMYFRFLHQAAHEDDETSENTDTKHKVRE